MKKWPIKVEPSILSGDFGRLAEEAKRIEQAGGDAIHIDVMDGHFVPNLTLGPRAVGAINKATDLFLDVHIMIYNPFEYVERFVEMGADRITFHFEATEDVEQVLKYIRKSSCQAGLAFNPETSGEFALRFLDQCDLILLMTVHPGFGGQKFMPEVVDKIAFIREQCDRMHIREKGIIVSDPIKREETPPFEIQVDGGIDDETAPQCIAAGANVLVSGNYLFSQPDMKKAIEGLRR